MSDSNLDQTFPEEGLREFLEAWTRQVVIVMTSVLGEPVECVDDCEPASTAPNFWLHQTFSPLGGALSVGLDREAVISIGSGLLKTAVEEEAPDRAIQSFAEMLGQVGAGMASQLSARHNDDVRAGALTQSDQRPSSSLPASRLRLVTVARSYPISVMVGVPAQPSTSRPTRTLAASGSLDLQAVNTRNLDLLLDVELPLSVSFGRAQLPLKDVIKLTTGSIVELNRSVSEPVDIIVNNCTIARGEVVVVEGNFGVRIKQIVSKQERLRSVT